MFDNPILLLGTATIASGIPVAIWMFFIFSKKEKSKKTIALVFLLGCLTAPALLGIQYLWDIFPQFNLSAFIENTATSQNKMFILTFILFGAMEEIIKMIVVTQVDKRTLLICTFNDAIRFSLVSALGFSFVENIYYLYQFWPSISGGELLGMYIFRSSFTAAAHMIFSGIFGYFYGAGKFAIKVKEEEVTGKKRLVSKAIARIFNLPLSHAFQQEMITKGLFLAVSIHATYNYLLQFNKTLPVMLFVIAGFLYLQYLLSRKTGHLVLETDISNTKKSSLAKKDEDVVVELVGMWFENKRYVDVIHICERLLERDPDNKVVKMFRAEALDKMDDKNSYKQILGSILKTKDKSVLSKYKPVEVKEQSKSDDEAKEEEKRKAKGDGINEITGDGTFKIS